MILAQLVKGYEVQIAKDNTLEMLGGVVNDAQACGNPQDAERHHAR